MASCTYVGPNLDLSGDNLYSGEPANLLSSVAALSAYMRAMEDDPPVDPTFTYSAASAALYQVNALARRMELAGMQQDSIVDAFALIRAVFSKSRFMRHIQTWPHGYQGDFEAVEYMMAGVNRSTRESWAWYLEEAVLHTGVVQQHRYKIHKQSQAFLRCLSETEAPRILTLGCGGCSDLLPILPLFRNFKGTLVLNDVDCEALALAQERISPATTRYKVIQMNVLKALKHLRSEGPFDLIVAGGLFDYLSDKAIRWLLKGIFFELLASHGSCVFTNIAQGNMFRPLMTYAAANWSLLERSEDAIHQICEEASIPICCVEIDRDESHLALIVRITRP